ncbi:MAG: (2Fe-2S)-binding protein [Pseudomonadota bacterium]|nr:(2Fe-2S)-binding protein [Pseudomonadota bacterium]
MNDLHPIHLTVNGRSTRCSVEPRQHLVDFLREDLGLTGSHLGCEHGVCGACTVRLDGQVVRGCLVLAVQADGRAVETVEGVTDSGRLRDLQDAFMRRNALQCGYCTSGMLMAAGELLDTRPDASREEVRVWMSGNYCRCTGYHAIVDAVCDVLASRRAAAVLAQAGSVTSGAGA